MSPSGPPFAELVRARMQERGVGLRELCRAVRIDPSFFSKVLAGKRSPPSEEPVLRRIAGALGFEASALIVAAGRIPLEWERVWKDESVLEAMHRLATGGAVRRPAPAAPASGAWQRARSAAVSAPASPRPESFGDELL